MLGNDLVLAPLQCMIELGYDADPVRNESAGSQRRFRRWRKVGQHQLDIAIKCGAFDLRETVSG